MIVAGRPCLAAVGRAPGLAAGTVHGWLGYLRFVYSPPKRGEEAQPNLIHHFALIACAAFTAVPMPVPNVAIPCPAGFLAESISRHAINGVRARQCGVPVRKSRTRP